MIEETTPELLGGRELPGGGRLKDSLQRKQGPWVCSLKHTGVCQKVP